MQRTHILAAALIAFIVVGAAAGFYLSSRSASVSSSSSSQTSTSKVQIVAAENFWGSLVSQLGGTQVQVLSIVSDPNADPHEYAVTSADARAVANANLVIVNGAGYDKWAVSLISASNNPHQKVLNVADLLGKKQGDNPHFWYDALYVNQTVHVMFTDLVSIDSANTAYYRQHYAILNASLHEYMSLEAEIKQKFAGTPVASTETIFEYMANATGLHVVSPPGFMESVSEGNDPAAQDVAIFQNQLSQKGTVKVLIFNSQTVTPLTEGLRVMAAQRGIPTVAVTETILPPDLTFQTWMNSELISLRNALTSQSLGQ